MSSKIGTKCNVKLKEYKSSICVCVCVFLADHTVGGGVCVCVPEQEQAQERERDWERAETESERIDSDSRVWTDTHSLSRSRMRRAVPACCLLPAACGDYLFMKKSDLLGMRMSVCLSLGQQCECPTTCT